MACLAGFLTSPNHTSAQLSECGNFRCLLLTKPSLIYSKRIKCIRIKLWVPKQNRWKFANETKIAMHTQHMSLSIYDAECVCLFAFIVKCTARRKTAKQIYFLMNMHIYHTILLFLKTYKDEKKKQRIYLWIICPSAEYIYTVRFPCTLKPDMLRIAEQTVRHLW